MNDLYKDAPEKADQLINEWRKTPSSKAQEWIIKHGRRNQNSIKILPSNGLKEAFLL